MITQEIKFCGKCASPLEVEKVGAEEYINRSIYGSSNAGRAAYDNKTGERMYCLHYYCPKSSFWNSGHYDFYEEI